MEDSALDTPSPAMTADERDNRDGKTWTSSAAEHAQDTASKAAGTVKDRVRESAEQQKTAGADRIDDAAEAMKAAADNLEQKIPLAAEYVDAVAGRLGSVASALRERSVDDMLGNCADFARRQPAVFFAGAMAAGFALSRFAKSSASRQDKPQDKQHG